ncbi:MAG: S8 family serine peptidase, partial [Actinobacteria bacterium]|nr:S8 family serine peptidase [Actinomycetota bacterium]
MGRSRTTRMAVFGCFAATLFLFFAVVPSWDAGATTANQPDGVPKAGHRGERVLLKFDRTLDEAGRNALLERYSLEVEETLDSIGALVAIPTAANGTGRGESAGSRGGEFGLSGQLTARPDLEALAREPGVAWAEPDTLFYFDKVPDDPDYALQWYLPAVGLPAAWEVSTGSPTAVVAILDTGLAYHSEFFGRVVAPYSVIWDSSEQRMWKDNFGHGTAVAAVVAAQGNNGSLISGTAWGVGIMPIHISDDGSAYASDLALAIDYAVDNGADVINISAGSDTRSETVAASVAYAESHDVLVVAASGNGSRSDLVQHPAALPGVVAVGSIGEGRARSGFSNGGPELDLVAPGERILTLTSLGGSFYLQSVEGTSFSAPIVSGVAGLIRSVAPSMSAKRMADLLSSTAKDLGPVGWDKGFGDGLVDAGSALVSAADTTLPDVSFLSPAPVVTVGGDVLVSMEAFDAVGVVRLEIRSNGKPLGAFVPRAPNPNTWDASKWGPWMVNSMKSPIKFIYDTNGDTHDSLVTIEAKAYDAAGNSRTAKVTVRINNRPPMTYATLTGTDRYETAILVSRQAYPSGAPAVCVVKGDDFPDALAAAPLAYAFDGPVILTPSGGLTPAVKAELKRLKPGKVFFIGLPETVRPGLVDAVGGA